MSAESRRTHGASTVESQISNTHTHTHCAEDRANCRQLQWPEESDRGMKAEMKDIEGEVKQKRSQRSQMSPREEEVERGEVSGEIGSCNPPPRRAVVRADMRRGRNVVGACPCPQRRVGWRQQSIGGP